MGGKKKSQVVGYKYYMGLHMGFCHGPVDNIYEVRVGDKKAWPTGNDVATAPSNWQDVLLNAGLDIAEQQAGQPLGTPVVTVPVSTGQITTSSKIYINNPQLFGGEEREGGIQGYVDFHMGYANEQPNDYLVAQLGPLVPGFRGVVTAVARRVYVAAMNPYIKPWSIYARRVNAQWDGSAQWYAAKAAIGSYDMNPAHMIREALTNKVWGKGRDVAEINDASFVAAADTLHAEGLGMSMVWADTRGVDDLIQNICGHIDASIYQDRVTNTWVLKLIRQDYNVNTLPVFDETNIVSIEELGRPLVSELVNQVTVTYWNRATRKDDVITIDNYALQDTVGGGIIPSDIDRTGISDTALAQRIAARELRTLSTALLTGRLVVNRQGMNLAMGSPFKLQLPRRGLESVVMRVTSIDYGTLDDGKMRVSMVEDIFALPTQTYLAVGGSLWQDPNKAPAASPYRYVAEAPYWTVIKEIVGDQGAYAQLDPATGFSVVAGSRASGVTHTMTVWDRVGSNPFVEEEEFSPTAVCRVPTAQGWAENSTFQVDQVVDPQNIVYGTYASWDNELIQVLSYNSTTKTLVCARGVLDTVPQTHAINSRILFVEGHQFVGDTAYTAGQTLDSKIVTHTTQGQLLLVNAPTGSVTFAQRHYRPYPPGQFRFNSTLLPPDDYYGSPMAWSAVQRNRLQQTAYIVQQNSPGIAHEAGTTYTVRIRNGNTNAVVRTVTGLATPNYTYAVADQIADGALGNPKIELTAVRDGVESWQSHSKTITRHGFGFNFGNEFGGVAA